MKIAFYMEDGLEQIVLTPQTEAEKAMLGKLHAKGCDLSIKRGSFYETRGGWVRFGNNMIMTGMPSDDESTIIVLRPVNPRPDPHPASPESPDASRSRE